MNEEKNLPESCCRANAAISTGFPLNTKSRRQPMNPCFNVAVHTVGDQLIEPKLDPVPPT